MMVSSQQEVGVFRKHQMDGNDYLDGIESVIHYV